MNYNDEIFRKSGIKKKFLDERTTLGCEIARLADHRIASGNRRNDLAQRNRERVIPGRNDGDYAERFVNQISALCLCGRAVMRNSPGAQSAGRVFGPIGGRIQGHKNIREQGLNAGLAGFANDGVRKLVSREQDALAKVAQLLASSAD